MIYIFHGDNETQIHTELFSRLNLAHVKGVDVIRLNAKKLDILLLETAVGTDALFASEKMVVIDGLFSLPKSKRRDEMITWLQAHDSESLALYLVEKKALTATQLKAFPTAKVQLFKYPALLFQWLETVGTVTPERELQLFHQLLEREEAELLFVMLVRQARTLLAFLADGVFDGPPFLRGKVASQAKFFTKARLLRLHAQLLELDEAVKTSRNTLSLSQNLDLILVGM